MANVTYQREYWADCWREVDVLWKAYAEEMRLEIDVDHETSLTLEQEEALFFVAMRADGDLVGGLRAICSPSLHCIGEVFAVSDGWYILPLWRTFKHANRLMRCMLDVVQQHEITWFYQSSDAQYPIGKLLERQGFEHIADTYRIQLLQETS